MLYVDMIDNENQRFTNVSIDYLQDRVSGYTILQVEQGLRSARSWNEWRDNMRHRHYNSTEIYINELFANWYQ